MPSNSTTPKAPWVCDLISKYRRARFSCDGLLREPTQAHPVKNIVPKDQRDVAVADKRLTDQERLREPVGRRLLRVAELDAELFARTRSL